MEQPGRAPPAAGLLPQPVLPLLLVLAAADAAAPRALLPPPSVPCVDGRFLGDLLRANETDSVVRAGRARRAVRRNVLVSFSTYSGWDVLCDGAAGSLHARLTYSLQFQAVGFNLKRGVSVKVAPHTVDIVVFLLGSSGLSLRHEVRRHISQVLEFFSRITPVLVTVVGGGLEDVDAVLDEVYTRGWFRASAALQEHGHRATVHGRDMDEVAVYARRPLLQAGERCGSRFTNSSRVVTWSPEAGGKTKNVLLSDGLFPPLPPDHDLGGCLVSVASMDSPPYVYTYTKPTEDGSDPAQARGIGGLDVELMLFFGKSKNATIHFEPPRRSHNSPWTMHWESRKKQRDTDRMDSVDMLANGVADVVVGGLFPTTARYAMFTLSTMYTTDALHCYVVREHPIPLWIYPFAVLSYKAWLALVIGMLCLVSTLTWLNRQGFATNAILLWGVLLEGRSMPSWMSTRTSLLLYVWIIFSMHFTAGYRASLAMANTKPLTSPGASNLLEAKRQLRRVGVIDSFMIPYLQQDSSLTELLQRVEVCRTSSNCSLMVRNQPDQTALILSSRSMKFQEMLLPRFFFDGNGRRTVKPLNQALYVFHVSAMAAHNSPILFALDDAIYRVQEAGLVAAWMGRLQTYLRRRVIAPWRRASSEPHALNLNQCVGPFFALAAGLFVASCAFVIEVVGYQGLKVAGIEVDAPDPDDGGDVHRDVGVDAPLQAIKAEAEAEEQAAAELAREAVAEAVAVSSVPATLLADGTAILGEGEGRYGRTARLEAEVMGAPEHVVDAAPYRTAAAVAGAEHGAATLLSDGTVLLGEAMPAVTMPGAATRLPDGTLLLGEAAAPKEADDDLFGEAVVSEGVLEGAGQGFGGRSASQYSAMWTVAAPPEAEAVLAGRPDAGEGGAP